MYSKDQERKLQSAIGQLIISRKFTVAKQGKNLILVKKFGPRPTTILLTKLDGAGFWISNPSRVDRCVNSFFDYADTPTRVTRNKNVLEVLVKHLQETKMWDFIENKDFFSVNPLNKKADKKVVANLLTRIRGEK